MLFISQSSNFERIEQALAYRNRLDEFKAGNIIPSINKSIFLSKSTIIKGTHFSNPNKIPSNK